MAIASACNSHSNFKVAVDTEVSILDLSVKFTYQVPSFSVFNWNSVASLYAFSRMHTK